MSDVEDLYQSIILDHNRRPRNFGEVEGATKRAEGKNPLCGDHVTVTIRMTGDVIDEVRFKGTGCAISRASASVMTAAVKGKTRVDAERLFQRFHALVTGQSAPPADAEDESPDKSFAVFSGVAKFPVRVKCAILAWHTLRAALADENGPVPAVVSTQALP